MRPEYIFMDLDGTISDPKEGITKAVAHALSYYGIQVENLDTLEKFIGPPLLDSFQDFYGFSEEQSREANLKLVIMYWWEVIFLFLTILMAN